MDHDQRMKGLLQALLSECVLLALPAWWPRFDFAEVEWLQQEVFMDPPQGEKRAVDLVAKVKLKQSVTANGAEHWLTLIHVEVEARDSVAPLRQRMFEYRSVLRTRHNLPVLPIALYLKVALDGIGWDEYEEYYWEERVEHFRFAYVGLPGLDAMTQVQGDNVLAMALTGLMRAPEDQRAQIKADAMQKAATCGKNDYVRSLLCEAIEAHAELHEPHLEQYRQLLLTPKYKEAAMFGLTSREEGSKEGQVKGRVDLLCRQLTKRFGKPNPSALAKLQSLSNEQLDELGENLLTASSMRELGLEP